MIIAIGTASLFLIGSYLTRSMLIVTRGVLGIITDVVDLLDIPGDIPEHLLPHIYPEYFEMETFDSQTHDDCDCENGRSNEESTVWTQETAEQACGELDETSITDNLNRLQRIDHSSDTSDDEIWESARCSITTRGDGHLRQTD